MSKEKFKFPEKSSEELAKEMDSSLESFSGEELTPQEAKEDDADGGYFDED